MRPFSPSVLARIDYDILFCLVIPVDVCRRWDCFRPGWLGAVLGGGPLNFTLYHCSLITFNSYTAYTVRNMQCKQEGRWRMGGIFPLSDATSFCAFNGRHM